jgi:hypothetical protein
MYEFQCRHVPIKYVLLLLLLLLLLVVVVVVVVVVVLLGYIRHECGFAVQMHPMKGGR